MFSGSAEHLYGSALETTSTCQRGAFCSLRLCCGSRRQLLRIQSRDARIILLLTFAASVCHERCLEIHLSTCMVGNKTKQRRKRLVYLPSGYVVTRAELKHTGKDPEAPPTALALILPDAYIAWEQLYQSSQSHQLCSHKLRTRQRFANAACHS